MISTFLTPSSPSSSPDLGDNSNLAPDTIPTKPDLYDQDMTTCTNLTQSTNFTFTLSKNSDCGGVCRSNYFLLYGQNLTQSGDEYTDFKIFIKDQNDKFIACNTSTFANTSCADNVLGETVQVRYTHTSSQLVKLCEIIIAGQESEEYNCTAGHEKENDFCEQCSTGTYSESGANCTDCGQNTYSAAGSGSCTDCDLMSYSSAKSSSCTNCTKSTPDTQRECYNFKGRENLLQSATSDTMEDWNVALLKALTKPKSCQYGPAYAEGQNDSPTVVNLKLNHADVNPTVDYRVHSVAVIGQAVNNDISMSTVGLSIALGTEKCPRAGGDWTDSYGTHLVFDCSSTSSSKGYQQVTLSSNGQQYQICNLFVFGKKFSEVEVEPGKYNDGTQILDCAAGSYSKGGAVTKCSQCPINQYQANTGQSSCLLCDDNKYSDRVGQKTCSDCPDPCTVDKECPTGCNLKTICEGYKEIDPVYGDYLWSDAKPNDTLSQDCQNNIGQKATKKCLASFQFEATDFTKCKSPVSEKIEILSNENITDSTQEKVSEKLANLTEESSDVMSAEDISTASNIITNLTHVTKVDDETLNNILKTANSISEKGQTAQLEESGGTVVNAVSDVASKLASQTNVSKEVKVVGTVAIIIPKETEDGTASELFLSADRSKQKATLERSTNENDTNTYFTAKVPSKAGKRATGVFYASDSMFPVDNAKTEVKVIGNVKNGEVNKAAISTSVNEAFKPNQGSDTKKGSTATVETVATVISSISYANSTGKEDLDEEDQLELTYLVEDVQVDTYRKVILKKDVMCKFYNESTKAWSTEGCITVKELVKGVYKVECKCNHMTSFAVLMSFSGSTNPAEDYVTQILLAASLVCLLATIVAYIPAEKMLKQRSVRINLLLVVSLILAIIIFFMMDIVVDKEISGDTNPSPGCIAVGFLMNYFWLCQMAWMVLEAVVMYMVLVRVFGSHISHYMLKFNLLAWGIPLLFPAIGLAVGGNDYIDPTTCFINKKYAYYVFYVPVILCIIFNCVIFALVARVIFRSKSAGQVSEQQQKKRQFKSALAVMVLLGAGWVFGFLLIIKQVNTDPLRWLFIIINCSQGILIFIFYVICNAELRKLWLQKLGIIEPASHRTTSSNTAQKYQSKPANKANTLSSAVSLPPAAKPDSTIYANDTPSPKGGYTNITQDVEKDAEGDNIYEDPDKPTMELKPMGK